MNKFSPHNLAYLTFFAACLFVQSVTAQAGGGTPHAPPPAKPIDQLFSERDSAMWNHCDYDNQAWVQCDGCSTTRWACKTYQEVADVRKQFPDASVNVEYDSKDFKTAKAILEDLRDGHYVDTDKIAKANGIIAALPKNAGSGSAWNRLAEIYNSIQDPVNKGLAEKGLAQNFRPDSAATVNGQSNPSAPGRPNAPASSKTEPAKVQAAVAELHTAVQALTAAQKDSKTTPAELLSRQTAVRDKSTALKALAPPDNLAKLTTDELAGADRSLASPAAVVPPKPALSTYDKLQGYESPKMPGVNTPLKTKSLSIASNTPPAPEPFPNTPEAIAKANVAFNTRIVRCIVKHFHRRYSFADERIIHSIIGRIDLETKDPASMGTDKDQPGITLSAPDAKDGQRRTITVTVRSDFATSHKDSLASDNFCTQDSTVKGVYSLLDADAGGTKGSSLPKLIADFKPSVGTAPGQQGDAPQTAVASNLRLQRDAAGAAHLETDSGTSTTVQSANTPH